jgi:DNA-directed RNA polymerase subunit RPC12/RpoP
MAPAPHCSNCKAPLETPRERLMPDRVMEYRCPACAYQIPMLPPGARWEEACPECDASPAPTETIPGVDSTGLLNFLACGSCGCVIGRYWGMLGL